MAKLQSVQDLLTMELKDLYSAEKQLTKALPKMRRSAHNEELAAAFEQHLKETQIQVERLERAGELLDITVSGKKCKGMEGIIAEGEEVTSQNGDPIILDLAITGAAARVEHYEIASYNGVIAIARKLGKTDVASLLTESLDEERHADEVMRKLAERLAQLQEA